MKTIISLCDLTGNMTQPWVDAGYSAFLVDPQHAGNDGFEWIGPDQFIRRFAGTIEEAMDLIGAHVRQYDVAMVGGFPPCTNMAVSGARWFESKRQADKMFQAKAVMVAEQCRTIGRLSGAPWFVENPVSVLSSAFGKPQHTFHPADFTAYEPSDNYTKKTCLWTGGASSCRSRLRTRHSGRPITGSTLRAPDPNEPTSAAQRPWGSPVPCSTPTTTPWSLPHERRPRSILGLLGLRLGRASTNGSASVRGIASAHGTIRARCRPGNDQPPGGIMTNPHPPREQWRFLGRETHYGFTYLIWTLAKNPQAPRTLGARWAQVIG